MSLAVWSCGHGCGESGVRCADELRSHVPLALEVGGSAWGRRRLPAAHLLLNQLPCSLVEGTCIVPSHSQRARYQKARDTRQH